MRGIKEIITNNPENQIGEKNTPNRKMEGFSDESDDS